MNGAQRKAGSISTSCYTDEKSCRKEKRRIRCAEMLQKEKVLCVDLFGSSGVPGYLFENFILNH